MKLTPTSIHNARSSVLELMHEPRIVYDYGIPAITDVLMSGPGHYVVMSAKTGTGKSALGLQMAIAMARSGRRVAYATLEMSVEQLAERSLAAAGTMAALTHRDPTESQARDMLYRTQCDANLPLEIVPAAGCTVRDLADYLTTYPTDVLIVDYMQLVRAPGSSRYEALTSVSLDLATLAHERGVLIIALAQQLIKGDTARDSDPGLDSIQGSSQMAQDADAVMIMTLEDVKNFDSRRVLTIVKNRHGHAGRRIFLDFDGNRMTLTPSHDQSRREPEKHQFKTFGKSKQDKPQLVPLPDYEQDELPL